MNSYLWKIYGDFSMAFTNIYLLKWLQSYNFLSAAVPMSCFHGRILLLKSNYSVHLNRPHGLDLIFNNYSARYLGTSSPCLSQKKFERPGMLKKVDESQLSENKKKKKELLERITLIGTDENITISTKDDAEKLAKRRNLKLVKIVDFDTKTQRAIYKLMTGSQYFEEDIKPRINKGKSGNGKKVEKLLTITSKIGENDLKAKLKNASKWLNKGHSIKVIINGNEGQSAILDNIYKTFEDNLKSDGRLMQKVTKGTNLKFQILPSKENQEKEVGNNIEETKTVDTKTET